MPSVEGNKFNFVPMLLPKIRNAFCTTEWQERIMQTVTDENGKLMTDESGNLIPPQQSKVISKDGEFTLFDGSKGHCELCGKLTCRGECFK